MTRLAEGPYDKLIVGNDEHIGWKPPDGFVASFDRRTIEQQSSLDENIQPADGCVIEWPAGTPLPPGYSPITQGRARANLQQSFDVSGRSGPRPPLPDRNGRVRLRIGRFRLIDQPMNTRGRPDKSRELVQTMYAEIREERGVESAGRWAGFMARKLRIPLNEAGGRLLPRRFRRDRILPPETQWSDNFDGPDGPLGQQLSWSNAGRWANESNQGFQTFSSNNGADFLGSRIENFLSGDDVSSQAVFREGTGSGQFAGTAARMSTDRRTYYGFFWLNGADTVQTVKYVSGVRTDLTPATSTTGHAVAVTGELQVSGSDLEVILGGVSEDTASDTAITTGRSGIMGFQTSSGQRTWFDDFVTKDLVPVPSFQPAWAGPFTEVISC